MTGLNQAQIDLAADVLRQRQMAGRITRPWTDLPNSAKRKWREHAKAMLEASATPDMLPIVELIAGIDLPPAAEDWPDNRPLIGYCETVITVRHVRAARAAIAKAVGAA